MRAGRLTYMLRILKPVTAVDRMGAEATTYVETATVHAERVRFSGRRSEEAAEHFPDYSVQFNIRDAHEVKENWRVQQLGGDLYVVTAIVPNLQFGYNTLVCERVNE